MDAKKCDACGVLYEDYMKISLINIVRDCHPYPEEHVYDLCPACQKKLENFIHYGEKKGGQKS